MPGPNPRPGPCCASADADISATVAIVNTIIFRLCIVNSLVGGLLGCDETDSCESGGEPVEVEVVLQACHLVKLTYQILHLVLVIRGVNLGVLGQSSSRALSSLQAFKT